MIATHPTVLGLASHCLTLERGVLVFGVLSCSQVLQEMLDMLREHEARHHRCETSPPCLQLLLGTSQQACSNVQEPMLGRVCGAAGVAVFCCLQLLLRNSEQRPAVLS